MRRAPLVRCLAFLLVVLPLFVAPAARGGYPVYRGVGFGFGLGFFPPSYYGYPLDDTTAGYYGGGRYREYYSYGRGYGWANYPGPVPGPIYRFDSPALQPPKRLPPTAPPPEPSQLASLPKANVAYLSVEVPADAEVWLEDTRTQQTGPVRQFVSPPLAPGGRYAYAVRARWTEEGREVEQTQEVIVQPGERARVHFPTGPELEPLPAPRKLAPEISGEP